MELSLSEHIKESETASACEDMLNCLDSEMAADDLEPCTTLDLADIEAQETSIDTAKGSAVQSIVEQDKDREDLESLLDETTHNSPVVVIKACYKDSIQESSAMQIAQEPTGLTNQKQECSGCKKNIIDRFLLKALDQYWHEDCLKCSCCDCRLGEVGSTLFAKANLLLCRRDYLRLFGTTGYCSACSKMIPAFEMVMRAKNNVYHLECFACQMCNHRFCVGDRFYLCDNKILCEYDYEERLVFANMTYNYNALTQIKRQTNSLSDDLSSGYGSPSPGSL